MRIGAPDVAELVVQPRVLKPAVSGPGVEQLASLGDALDRGSEVAAEDVDPTALQQKSVDVQRLLDLPPVPLGVTESLVGVVERLHRDADQPEVQPAP